MHRSSGSNFSFSVLVGQVFISFSISPPHSSPHVQHWKLIAGLGYNDGSLKGTKWQEDLLWSPEFEMNQLEGLIKSSAAVAPAPVQPGLVFNTLRETVIKSTDREEHEKKTSPCAASRRYSANMKTTNMEAGHSGLIIL